MSREETTVCVQHVEEGSFPSVLPLGLVLVSVYNIYISSNLLPIIAWLTCLVIFVFIIFAEITRSKKVIPIRSGKCPACGTPLDLHEGIVEFNCFECLNKIEVNREIFELK